VWFVFAAFACFSCFFFVCVRLGFERLTCVVKYGLLNDHPPTAGPDRHPSDRGFKAGFVFAALFLFFSCFFSFQCV
jgi:hypothetical protein